MSNRITKAKKKLHGLQAQADKPNSSRLERRQARQQQAVIMRLEDEARRAK